MFLTDNQLAVALGATLGLPNVTGVASLPEDYQTIVPAANLAAYNAIMAVLVGERLLTKAQADTWVDGATFQRSIGQYFAIIEGNGLEGIAAGTAATWGYLDRRKELATVVLLDSSYLPIVPEEDAETAIGHGELNTDGDLNRLDPYDRRLGRYDRGPTKW